MIQARGFHQDNTMILEINIPGRIAPQYKTIIADTRAERLEKGWEIIYGMNKNRISVALCSWLKQRVQALQEYCPDKALEASRLLVLMHYHNQFNFFKLCRLVADNRSRFEFVAPHNQSRYYNFYTSSILPILDECELLKERTL